MKQTLLTNLFLKTIYNEASPEKRRFTRELIAKDWGKKEEFLELSHMVKSLPRLSISPSDNVMKRILSISLNTHAGASY